MSRAAGGAYTLPAGNPVVTGTIISSTWGNTTLSDIATALTDSLSRSGLGGMTAALLGTDGTQALPAYSFTNEPSSGFYRIGAGNIGLSVLNRLTWNVTSAGNMTINAPSSGTAFILNGVAGGSPLLINSGSEGSAFYTNQVAGVTRGYLGVGSGIGATATNFGVRSEAGLSLLAGGATERILISSTGNVTINAPSSGTVLTANGLGGSNTFILGSTGAAATLNTAWNVILGASWNIFTQSTDPLNIGTTGAATLTLSTNSAARIVAASAGNVTINAPSSGVALVVGGINGQANATIFEGLNSINAQKNAATYETGSFTGTLTGCTTSPTATFNWTRNGNIVTIDCNSVLTATSNTVNCTVTGAPAAINPARTQTIPFAQATNNSIAQQLAACQVGTSGTLTFLNGVISGTVIQFVAATWTAAGTKGIASGFSITYSLT